MTGTVTGAQLRQGREWCPDQGEDATARLPDRAQPTWTQIRGRATRQAPPQGEAAQSRRRAAHTPSAKMRKVLAPSPKELALCIRLRGRPSLWKTSVQGAGLPPRQRGAHHRLVAVRQLQQHRRHESAWPTSRQTRDQRQSQPPPLGVAAAIAVAGVELSAAVGAAGRASPPLPATTLRAVVVALSAEVRTRPPLLGSDRTGVSRSAGSHC